MSKYMRFLILLAACLFVSSCVNKKSGCDDYLKYFGADIAAEYQSCEYIEEGQLDYFEVRYKVDYQDFREVESFLVENYGMSELRFVCCLYETQGWSWFKFQGVEYSFDMISEEFGFTESDKDLKFWVFVRRYERIEI